MNISAKWRGILYNTSIVVSAAGALALAVMVVVGTIEKDQIMAVVMIASELFVVFTSALARKNLTPDA
jgi:hypothetical protein